MIFLCEGNFYQLCKINSRFSFLTHIFSPIMKFDKLTADEMQRLDKERFKMAEKLPVCIVLDNIRSAHNVGSIFRTADAFRIESIYLTGICATPPQKDVMKTALGATETVQWKYFLSTVDALTDLKEKGFSIVAVEQVKQSEALQAYMPSGKTAFVFGNEVSGVSADALEQCDQCIEIPQFGSKHSFNVAITAGMVLWDVFTKTKKHL